MTNKWQNDSEVVCGLVLKDKLSADAVNPDSLLPPYNEIILYKRAGMNVSEMVLKGVPFTILNGSLLAGEKVDGSLIDWLKVVETDAVRAQGGKRLRKEAEKLESGEEADVGVLIKVVSDLENGFHEMISSDQVEPAEDMFILTGYEPIDKYVGGIPKASMTIFAGSPGIGKTSFGIRMITSMIRKHPKKYAAIFSLEMTNQQIVKRLVEIEDLNREERKRLLLNDDVLGPQEVYSIASRAAASFPLSVILIDFADQMVVNGEQTEAVMGSIYRQMAALAKRTGIPVFLIAQLNRSTYDGGIPRMNHIRWSGMAEASAALILLGYNPSNIYVDSKSNAILPSIGGVGYIIEAKSRYGYKMNGTGAVQLGWGGETGWDKKAMGWFPLG